MNKFIGDRTQSGHVDERLSLYELRGVLLHKGASAHHGHYEAQVYNSRYIFKVQPPPLKLTYTVGSKATQLGTSSTMRLSLRWNPCTSELESRKKMTQGMLYVSKCRHF